MTRQGEFTNADRRWWEQFAKDTNISSRDLAKYQKYLQITHDDLHQLKGKTVLDIGSGENQTMQREIKSQYPTIHLVSTTLHHREGMPTESPTVVAYAQEQPFADESFDEVWALFSTPYYLPDVASLTAVFQEIVRVLKPGGWARIAPVSPDMWTGVATLLTQSDVERVLQAMPGITWEIFSDTNPTLLIIQKK